MTFDYNCIKSIHPTLDDYKKIDWNTILSHTPDDINAGFYICTFSKLRDKSYDQKNLEFCKIFWLLGAVASFQFRDPKSMHKPFSPLNRSAPIPEDFTRDDIQFFRDVLPEIQDIFLSSRIADTLWTVSDPRRNPDDALKAIDLYLQYPLNKDGFYPESFNAWLRAIYLSKILKENGKQKYDFIVETLYNTCSNPTISKNVDLLHLSQLLQEFPSDLTTEQKEFIINTLEECAKSQRSLDSIQSYYDEAFKWCEISKSQKRAHELISNFINIIEQNIDESLSRNPESLGEPKLNYDLETAIRYLRKISDDDVSKYNTKNRIQKLRDLKTESDKEILKQMKKISSEPINLEDFIKESKEKISGKSMLDALCGLVTIHPQINVADLRETAKKIMKDHPLCYLFVDQHIDSSGHKIASIPPPNLGDLDSEDSQPAVSAETIIRYKIMISLIAQGCIYPALLTFNREHHITEYDLLQLVPKYSVVDSDRELIWAKALYYGFELDFIISTHLLTPQFEHMIRRLLQQNRVITTYMDEDGNESEKALGTLLKENEEILSKSFGKNIYFELKTLLSEKIGLNLRNKVAHGLMDSNDFNSYYLLYFWWFALRLIFPAIICKDQETVI